MNSSQGNKTLMNLAIGFDIGWNQIAFAILDEKEKIIKYDMHFYEEPVLLKIFEKVLNVIDKYKPLVIGVEKPFGINPSVLIKLSEVKGIIRLACQIRDIVCIDMTPSQAKAMTGIVSKKIGKDLKKQVKDNTKEYYKTKYDYTFDEFVTEHEYDAITIALYTLNKAKKDLSRLFVC